MRFAAVFFAVLLMSPTVLASTWYIQSDGAGDAPTIQAGIDSASSGDTVLVEYGIYLEHDISMKSGICLISETGRPDCVTIDAQQMGRVIHCSNIDNTARIEGFTLTHGRPSGVWPNDRGGGIECDYASPTIEYCDFIDNWAVRGGGMRLRHSSSIVRNCNFISNSTSENGGGLLFRYATANAWNCSFISNTAGTTGGGVKCFESSPILENCSFANNSATTGGGIAVQGPNANPSVINTILAFSASGAGLYCDGGAPTFSCSDVFGNTGGDFIGCNPFPIGIDGNFSSDPLYCDQDYFDLSLHSNSPCAPGNHPTGGDCGLIGALSVGCGSGTAVEITSWGGVKALFR